MTAFLKKVAPFVLLLLCCSAFGQGDDVEMADVLRRDGKIYTVVAALTLILTAVIVVLLRVDRKVARVERELDQTTREQ